MQACVMPQYETTREQTESTVIQCQYLAHLVLGLSACMDIFMVNKVYYNHSFIDDKMFS